MIPKIAIVSPTRSDTRDSCRLPTVVMMALTLVLTSCLPAIAASGEGQPRQGTLPTNTISGQITAASDSTSTETNRVRSSVHWMGWEGLHYEFARKTGYTNAPTAPDQEIEGLLPRLRLDEIKGRGKIGMKFVVDAAAFSASKDLPEFNDGIEIRDARIFTRGELLLFKPIAYEIDIGYIPNEIFLEESYLALREVRLVGEIKVGQYKTPMGLDLLTGSRDRTFMEPAAVIQALTPGVNAGVQIGRSVLDQRATWRLGFFGNGAGSEFGNASSDAARAVGRLTWLPMFEQDPERPWTRRLLHLGLSADYVYSGSGSFRFRSRPESHLAPYVVDTDDIAADSATTIGLETAWVNGPFSLQGEYLHTFVPEKKGDDLQFYGFYATASWFLTGESRAYDRVQGRFGRVSPRHPLDFGQGHWGAWEVAGRFSYTDLTNGDVQGGRLADVTAGLTWYPHAHVRWKFNYVFGRVSGRPDTGLLNIFETRVEFDL